MSYMKSPKKLLHGLFSFRHHYIMMINFTDTDVGIKDRKISLDQVLDYSKLMEGTYSVSLQKRIIDATAGKCDVFILRDKNTQNNIETLSVMYMGGDELEYKIRKIDAFIYNVSIDKSFRGKGYAGIMIQMLGEILAEKGIGKAYLAVSTDNSSAIRAYEKAGFIKVNEKFFIRSLKRNVPYYSL